MRLYRGREPITFLNMLCFLIIKHANPSVQDNNHSQSPYQTDRHNATVHAATNLPLHPSIPLPDAHRPTTQRRSPTSALPLTSPNKPPPSDLAPTPPSPPVSRPSHLHRPTPHQASPPPNPPQSACATTHPTADHQTEACLPLFPTARAEAEDSCTTTLVTSMARPSHPVRSARKARRAARYRRCMCTGKDGRAHGNGRGIGGGGRGSLPAGTATRPVGLG